MRRNLLHAFVFLATFIGMFWHLKDDARRKTVGMRNLPAGQVGSPRAVRAWAPEDTAFIAFLAGDVDTFTIHALFNDMRLIVDRGVVARFAAAQRAREDTLKRRKPYAWLFTDSSVARGKRFLSQYEEFLDSVGRPFGVPPEVIAAVLRTETNFGAFSGRYPVVNALYTAARLADDTTRRNPELRELSALLRIMRGKPADSLFTLLGSWRGAFGLPQFRPSSYLTYAADGDGDGVVDLFTLPDAVASASHYLKAYGWSKSHLDQQRALYAYNRGAYATAVLSYAARIATD